MANLADGTCEDYRQALRDAVASVNSPLVRIAEGPDLMPMDAHSDDLVHPSDLGMGIIAERLAPQLAAIL